MKAVENRPAVTHAASTTTNNGQQIAMDGGQPVEDDNSDESEDENEESPSANFADYPVSEGDHVTVDWSEGQGPWDEITGMVEDIGISAGEIVVGVTDYDDDVFGEEGRKFDCAPEWIQQPDETDSNDGGEDCPECGAEGTVQHEPQPGADTIPTYVCSECRHSTFTLDRD